MSLITDLANAIDRQEGPDKNNNPGNIWDGVNAGKPKRIWPNLPIDSRGFVIYPTPQAGRAALENDLAIKVNRGMTLTSLLNMYAPPIENDTATYIRNVSAWTGIPPNVPLNALGDSPGNPIPPSQGQELAWGGLEPSFDPYSYDGAVVVESSTVNWEALVLVGLVGLGIWLVFGD